MKTTAEIITLFWFEGDYFHHRFTQFGHPTWQLGYLDVPAVEKETGSIVVVAFMTMDEARNMFE